MAAAKDAFKKDVSNVMPHYRGSNETPDLNKKIIVEGREWQI